jgi:hypothetical protein
MASSRIAANCLGQIADCRQAFEIAEGQVLQDGKHEGDDPVLMLMGRVSILCNDVEKLIIRLVRPSRGVPVLADSGN